jgi:hypothetical protein
MIDAYRVRREWSVARLLEDIQAMRHASSGLAAATRPLALETLRNFLRGRTIVPHNSARTILIAYTRYVANR